MDHAHRWRATNKVFALVCECGLVYHDWLLAEVDRLKKPASSDDVAVLRIQLDEALVESAALRTQIDEAQAESTRLRALLDTADREGVDLRTQLDEAKQQLEKQAQEVANKIAL